MPEGDADPPNDDYGLFRLMSFGHRDQALARAAWNTLFLRYNERLIDQLRRPYGRLVGGDAGVCDLAQDTWVRAYRHADTYVASPSPMPAEEELWTLGWLRSLARSSHFDKVRLAARSYAPERGVGAAISAKRTFQLFEDKSSYTAGGARDAERQQVIFHVLENLSDRDRDIVHVSFQWYGPDDQQCRIPAEELEYLRLRWQIDDASIRKIRQRVLRKIEVELNKRLLSLTRARTA